MPGDPQTVRTASELVAAWLLDMESDRLRDPNGEYRAALVRALEELPVGEVPNTGPLMAALVEMLAVAVGGIAELRGTSPRHELGQLLLRFESIIDPPGGGD